MELNPDDIVDIVNEQHLYSTPVFTNRARTIPDPQNEAGGVIQPLNPHFAGYEVVVDVEIEDPDVQWIPNPGYVAIVIADEEAILLSQEEISAIHVAREGSSSTDDERPAASYSLLDRRRYREDDSVPLESLSPIPLAIGLLIDNDDEVLPLLGSLPVTQQLSGQTVVHSTTDQHLQQSSYSLPRRRRVKRKRKVVKKDEDPHQVLKGPFKRDSDDEDGPRKHPPRIMSGRRHSGLSNCA